MEEDHTGIKRLGHLYHGSERLQLARARHEARAYNPAWYDKHERSHRRAPDGIHVDARTRTPFVLFAACSSQPYTMIVSAHSPDGATSWLTTESAGTQHILPIDPAERARVEAAHAETLAKQANLSARDYPYKQFCITSEINVHTTHRSSGVAATIGDLTSRLLESGALPQPHTHLAPARELGVFKPHGYQPMALLTSSQHAAYARWGSLPAADDIPRVVARTYQNTTTTLWPSARWLPKNSDTDEDVDYQEFDD